MYFKKFNIVDWIGSTPPEIAAKHLTYEMTYALRSCTFKRQHKNPFTLLRLYVATYVGNIKTYSKSMVKCE